MEVLGVITLHQVLHAAYGLLTAAWKQYPTVQDQKAQCEVLLRRCSNLLVAVAKRLEHQSEQHIFQNIKVLEGYACK
jgi:hypothetical protein